MTIEPAQRSLEGHRLAPLAGGSRRLFWGGDVRGLVLVVSRAIEVWRPME